MAELTLMKTATGALVPADQETVELLARLKVGQGMKGEFKRARNLTNHRRLFSLFKLAFDTWEAPAVEYKGQPVEKNFDRFRKDLTILAGFSDVVVNLKGEVRLEPKSLAFSNMPEDEFYQCYRAILDVVWRKVLKDAGYLSPEAVNEVVENLLRYD